MLSREALEWLFKLTGRARIVGADQAGNYTPDKFTGTNGRHLRLVAYYEPYLGRHFGRPLHVQFVDRRCPFGTTPLQRPE